MVTDYFSSIPIFSSVRKKIEKNFWDMGIIGNRRKIKYVLKPSRNKNGRKFNLPNMVFLSQLTHSPPKPPNWNPTGFNCIRSVLTRTIQPYPNWHILTQSYTNCLIQCHLTDLIKYDNLDLTWSDLIWSNLIWYNLIWSNLIWSDLIRLVLSWSDLIWPNPTWLDLIWSEIILC